MLHRFTMLRARDLMNAEPVTVPSGASLLDVQHLLVVTHIGGVPVIDTNGVVVGIVSASDVLGAMAQALDEDRDEGEPEDLLAHLQAITASEVANPEVVWVSPDAPAAQIAEVMRKDGLHRVLVGTRDRLEGIITAYDLLRAV